MEYNDKLNLLRGADYEVNDSIHIAQPTLSSIWRYGEKEYWELITMLSATSFDYRFQLDDMGFDYEDVEDFTVFCMVSPALTPDSTWILFGDLDLSSFKVVPNEDGIMLINQGGVVIDKIIYELIVGYIRELHSLKRNYVVAGNKAARKFYMEEERKALEEKIKEGKSEFKSVLEPLISSMINCADFKYNYSDVWDLGIYQFMDSVKRVQKINNYKNLMVGVYTGNIDGTKLKKDQINWQGEL